MKIAIINIGDEILSGDIENTNAAWLARQLSNIGAVVVRIKVVPDEKNDIIEEISNTAADWIIVTGGLGPTHDDKTRESIAQATNCPLAEDEDALCLLKKRYPLTPQVRYTANIPLGSKPLDNPEGVAPGFIIKNLIVLPGVPGEMKSIFNSIRHLFISTMCAVDWVCTRLDEAAIAPLLREALVQFPGIKIGSYPQNDNSVKIKIQSVEKDDVEAAKTWLLERI